MDYVEITNEKEIHPAGIVKARLVDLINQPHQKNPFWRKDDPKSPEYEDKIQFVFETAKRRKNGKPFWLSLYCTTKISSGGGTKKESNLHKHLVSWLGEEFTGRFNSHQVEDRPAMLVVSHKKKMDGSMKAVIDTVLPDDDPSYAVSGEYQRWTPKEEGSAESEVPF